MAARGSTLKALAPSPTSSPVAGKTVVFTGALEKMTREEAKPWPSVSAPGGGRRFQKDGYSVAGPGAGSKLKDAEKHDVKVIDEAGWFTLGGQA